MSEPRRLRVGVVGIDPYTVHLLTYVRYLAERGHDVTVVTNRSTVDAPVRVRDFASGSKAARVLPRGLRALPRIWRLWRCLATGGFDVVNVQQMTPDGVYAALLWRGPLVLDFWGSDIHRLDERPRLIRRLMRHAIRRASAIHSVSAEMTRVLVEHGADPGRVETFQYGIDLATFGPGASERPGHTIVSSRGLRPFYRVHEIVRAMPLVLGQVPDARLVVMGPGDDSAVKELARDLGVHDRVEFAGLLGPAAVADRLRAARVWVSLPPSDGTPLSLLEAMACGAVPVVADVPSLREWIDENRAVIVEEVTPATVAEAIIRAFDIFDSGRHFAPNLEAVRERADRAANLPRWERMLVEAARSKAGRT